MAFQESQKMNQGLRILVIVAMIPGLIITGQEWMDSYETETLVAFMAILFITVLVYFVIVEGQAETRIDTQGIHYKYWPFVRSWKIIPWVDIRKVEVKSIRPLTDFGGWGYRWGRKGKGIILSGKRAIVIVKKEGKKFCVNHTPRTTCAA